MQIATENNVTSIIISMTAFFVSRWECVHCGMKKSSDSYLLLRFLEHCACACCVLFVSRNRYPSIITIEISPTCSNVYRIAGNFRGRKLSRISRFFSHPRKFSPRNSRHATPIIRSVFAFRESFLHEMLLSYRSAKVFSLENFPLYGTYRGFSTLCACAIYMVARVIPR